VDESLQVYGGNGYSREFPAERAYRDARITRIYEGTNEINRLIVGTRLAKSPAVTAAMTAGDAAAEESASTERALLGRAKRLTLQVLGAASKKYGKGLSSEQEVVGRLADMAIEVYALESAILRAEKMQTRGGGHAATAVDMCSVFAADAADRLRVAAKNALATIEGPDAAAAIDRATTLLRHGPVDTIAARRRIADAVIAAGRYPL
jgi:alkylation response protein AidB-like acyl-CoA dehydrogenase